MNSMLREDHRSSSAIRLSLILKPTRFSPLLSASQFRSPSTPFYCQHSAKSDGTSTYVALGNHDGAEIKKNSRSTSDFKFYPAPISPSSLPPHPFSGPSPYMASDPVPTKETIENEASSDAESLRNDFRHTATEERQLVRKLDGRILPIACLLYLFACLSLSFSLLVLPLT